jgi:hypothetical protein
MNIDNWDSLDFKRKCEYMSIKILISRYYKKEQLNKFKNWDTWDILHKIHYMKRRIYGHPKYRYINYIYNKGWEHFHILEKIEYMNKLYINPKHVYIKFMIDKEKKLFNELYNDIL